MKNKRNRDALTAGLLYLALIIVGMYGFAYALPQIIMEGDVISTMANIAKSEMLFRIGIFSILFMNVISIILALYLFRLLVPINQSMATSMLTFLLVGAGISLLNEVNHFALLYINTHDYMQAQDLSLLFLDMHKYGSYIAVIFWGLWLFPLGILVHKLGTGVSKFIGIMVLVAGVGYVLDAFVLFVNPNLWSITLSDFTFVGELFLTIWLLFKSGEVQRLVLNKVITENG